MPSHHAVPSPDLYVRSRHERAHPQQGTEHPVLHEPRTGRQQLSDTLVFSQNLAPRERVPSHFEPAAVTRQPVTSSSTPRRQTITTQAIKSTKKPVKQTSRLVTTKVVKKPVSGVDRRPGWDTDVRTTSSVFDATLKKSVLFQPRSGDRQRELQDEAALLRPLSTGMKKERRPTLQARGKWQARAPPALQTQLPKRRPKDFVKLNVERITGRPFRLAERATGIRSSNRRGSVFDRLSAPVQHKSVVRFRDPSPSRTPVASPKRRPTVEESESLTLEIASPIVDPQPPEKDSSIQAPITSSIRRSPNQEELPRNPSPQSRRSTKTPPSSSSPRVRATRVSPSRRSPQRSREENNVAVQVFEVLDRQRRGRIGVNQILDGLRLLGLPATHNQVSDYVYLIHEGSLSTIDLEEWIILVGTLDAAAQPTPNLHNSGTSGSNRSPHGRVERTPSPRRSPQSSQRSHSSPVQTRAKTTTTTQTSVHKQNRHKYSAELDDLRVSRDPPSHPDEEDWYMTAIQRRVDEMYERAEEVVAQRMTANASDQMLERTASAVYQLKSSLFPLIQQAEETIKDIHRHRGAKLSLQLDQRDLSRVEYYSEDLANAILDDLLLDTVEDLNAEERKQARHTAQANQVDELESILCKIEQIEAAENEMVRKGFVLGYQVGDLQPKLASDISASVNRDYQYQLHVDDPSQEQHVQLPLEVAMKIDIPEESTSEEKAFRPTITRLPSATPLEPIHRSIDEGPKVSMAVLSGARFQRIEKSRVKFQKYRSLVESSLDATGMDQAAVIELLADMMIDDLVLECATELDEGVNSLSDTLVAALL